MSHTHRAGRSRPPPARKACGGENSRWRHSRWTTDGPGGRTQTAPYVCLLLARMEPFRGIKQPRWFLIWSRKPAKKLAFLFQQNAKRSLNGRCTLNATSEELSPKVLARICGGKQISRFVCENSFTRLEAEPSSHLYGAGDVSGPRNGRPSQSHHPVICNRSNNKQ